MPAMEFPRTMTKGRFKGRTFKTQADYQAALRNTGTEYDLNGKAHEVRRTIELYDMCITAGMGKDKSINFVAQALRA